MVHNSHVTNSLEFTSDWGFEHRMGSPGNQQTNGKVEAAVKEAKQLLRKAKETNGDIYLAVLVLCNTPMESMENSSTQRLLGQRCKTRLLITKQLLKPQTKQPDAAHKQQGSQGLNTPSRRR